MQLPLKSNTAEEAKPYLIFLYLTLSCFILLYLTLPDFTFFAYLSRMSYADHAGIPEERLGGPSNMLNQSRLGTTLPSATPLRGLLMDKSCRDGGGQK